MRISQIAAKYKWIALILAGYVAAQALRIIFLPSITWDESVYIGIGKYLWSAGQVGLYENIRPLIVPLLSGALWKLALPLGVLRFVMLGFAVGAAAMLYVLVRRWTDDGTALLSATLLLLSPVFFEQSTLVLTEIPALFFILLGFYLFESQGFFFAGAIIGLAFLTKFPAGMLLPCCVLILVMRRRYKAIMPLVASFVLITVPYFILNYALNGSVFAPLVAASLHGGNTAYAVHPVWLNVTFYIVEVVKDNMLLVFLIPGLFVARWRKAWPFVMTGGFFLAYFTLQVNKQLRFAIFLIPVFCYLAASFMVWIYRNARALRVPIGLLFVGAMFLVGFQDARSVMHTQEYPRQVLDYLRDAGSTVVLTTDPTPVAFIDDKFIPFYFFTYDVHNAKETYIEYRNASGLILFTPDAFACYLYPNTPCEEIVNELGNQIAIKDMLALNVTANGQQYLVYRRLNDS